MLKSKQKTAFARGDLQELWETGAGGLMCWITYLGVHDTIQNCKSGERDAMRNAANGEGQKGTANVILQCIVICRKVIKIYVTFHAVFVMLSVT